jgi:hypothetical protein
LLSETISPQSWLDFAEIVDRIESKQKSLKSPHEQGPGCLPNKGYDVSIDFGGGLAKWREIVISIMIESSRYILEHAPTPETHYKLK